MRYNKFYIIAMAASGKSTFATEHSTYKGYHIVDYAERLPPYSPSTRVILYLSRLFKPLRKIIKQRPDLVARRRDSYFSTAFEYIISHDAPIVVFGRKPPDNFQELPVHDKIKFCLVLIPESDHRRNCASRKKELRNPLFFLNHWTTDFGKIRELRINLEEYSKRHDIPVYESFAEAIDDMHQQFNSA